MVFELLCLLTKYKEKYKTIEALWYKKIIDKFEKDREKKPHKLKNFLLKVIIVLSSNLQGLALKFFDQIRLLTSATKIDHQILRSTLYNHNN